MIASILGAAFMAATAAGGQNVNPVEALRQSMDRTQPVNFEAILSQRAPRVDGRIKTRLWRDKTGKRRTEIISPAPLQGQVSVDDGTQWSTFFPDRNAVLVHPSPLAMPDDLHFRMKLLRRNYKVEVDEKTTIAGRAAIRVVAKPKWSELETRRYYLDAANYVTLKMDTVNEAGDVAVQFVTLRIDYSTSLPGNIFEFPPYPGARRDMVAAPERVSVDEAARRIGFRPILPSSLPMGFKRQEVAVLTRGDWKPVAIRLTDGLVRLNVYQFKRDPDREKRQTPDERRVFRDVGPIRIEVAGDAPTAVRERIVAAFVRMAEVAPSGTP